MSKKKQLGRRPVVDTELSAFMVERRITDKALADVCGAHAKSAQRWRHGARMLRPYLWRLRQRWHEIPVNADGTQRPISPA